MTPTDKPMTKKPLDERIKFWQSLSSDPQTMIMDLIADRQRLLDERKELVEWVEEWAAAYSEKIFPERDVNAMTKHEQAIVSGASGRMGRHVLKLILDKLGESS